MMRNHDTSGYAVQVSGLTKAYGKTKAVDNVSFTMEADKIYGLLGRNGAGKTTVMHMLSAQLFPTSGDVKVFGEAPYENRAVLDRICFIKESQKYPQNFTVAHVLDVAGSFMPNWDREYALKLTEEFRLPLHRKMNKLSRGMLSSVGIVVGLASRAPLTIFDEPYLGLDAVARSLFYDRLIEDYTEHPRTIILSTHLIDEVSRILEHILVIDNGRLRINEDADALRQMAYSVAGKASVVEEYTAGKQIIHREPFGALAAVTVMGRMDETEKKRAASLQLELAPVSMQQLIVFKTTDKSKEANV